MAEPLDSASPTQSPSETPTAVPPVASTSRRRAGLMGPLLGGVLAASLGFGLAQIVPGGWPIAGTAALQAQLDRLAAQNAAQNAALKAQLDGLASQPALAPDLAERLTALENQPAAPDLSADLADLAARVAALAATPSGTGVDASALKALQDQVAALTQTPVTVPAEIEAAVRAAKDQLAAATAEAEAQARKLTELGAWRQLAAALDSGAPFAGPLADLADLTLPPVLSDHATAGLPTLQGLRDSFTKAARTALDAARRADMGASWTERVTTFLQTQTGARSLEPREGDDPDAILSRAQAALDQGDLATALAEIATLPEAARLALADWQVLAQLRLDAGQALADLGKALGQ